MGLEKLRVKNIANKLRGIPLCVLAEESHDALYVFVDIPRARIHDALKHAIARAL